MSAEIFTPQPQPAVMADTLRLLNYAGDVADAIDLLRRLAQQVAYDARGYCNPYELPREAFEAWSTLNGARLHLAEQL